MLRRPHLLELLRGPAARFRPWRWAVRRVRPRSGPYQACARLGGVVLAACAVGAGAPKRDAYSRSGGEKLMYRKFSSLSAPETGIQVTLGCGEWLVLGHELQADGRQAQALLIPSLGTGPGLRVRSVRLSVRQVGPGAGRKQSDTVAAAVLRFLARDGSSVVDPATAGISGGTVRSSSGSHVRDSALRGSSSDWVVCAAWTEAETVVVVEAVVPPESGLRPDTLASALDIRCEPREEDPYRWLWWANTLSRQGTEAASSGAPGIPAMHGARGDVVLLPAQEVLGRARACTLRALDGVWGVTAAEPSEPALRPGGADESAALDSSSALFALTLYVNLAAAAGDWDGAVASQRMARQLVAARQPRGTHGLYPLTAYNLACALAQRAGRGDEAAAAQALREALQEAVTAELAVRRAEEDRREAQMRELEAAFDRWSGEEEGEGVGPAPAATAASVPWEEGATTTASGGAKGDDEPPVGATPPLHPDQAATEAEFALAVRWRAVPLSVPDPREDPSLSPLLQRRPEVLREIATHFDVREGAF